MGGSPSQDDPAASEAELLERLLSRARRGDTQAWARLYQAHFDAIHRHATYLVGDPSLGEDLVQDVFAQAMVSIARYDGRSSFLGWLRGITSNIARMHWRSQSRRRSAYDRLNRSPTDRARSLPDEAHVQAKQAEALLAALEILPANLREAFVLLDLQERDADEVAAELGLSVGNLRVRASRARGRVREILDRQGWLERRSER